MKVAPVMAVGEQRIPARRADARRGMTVRKTSALRGQAIEVRRRDFRLRVVAAQVPIPEIVGIEDHDIGQRRFRGDRVSRAQNDDRDAADQPTPYPKVRDSGYGAGLTRTLGCLGRLG